MSLDFGGQLLSIDCTGTLTDYTQRCFMFAFGGCWAVDLILAEHCSHCIHDFIAIFLEYTPDLTGLSL